MYFDIEAVGNINDIENMKPICVTLKSQESEANVSLNLDGLAGLDWNFLHTKMSQGNEFWTFNGAKFDFRLLSSQKWFSDKFALVKECCLDSVDLHLNICMTTNKLISLGNLCSCIGIHKMSGGVIPIYHRERSRDKIAGYVIDEADSFYSFVDSLNSTDNVFHYMFGGSMRWARIEKLMTVRECMLSDITNRWIEKYDWLID